MKIDGQLPKLPVQEKNVSRNEEKEAVGKDHKIDTKKSKIGGSGNQDFAINRLKSKIESEPDVNLDKVKELKEKIKNGQYEVDSAKLARNLIKNSIIEDI